MQKCKMSRNARVFQSATRNCGETLLLINETRGENKSEKDSLSLQKF